MSKLNPNAGEWVPSFSVPVPAASPAASSTSASPIKGSAGPAKTADGGGKATTEASTAAETGDAGSKTALARAADFGHDTSTTEDGAPISYEGYSPLHDRFIYSKEYLLAVRRKPERSIYGDYLRMPLGLFKPLGDHVIKRIPDVVRDPSPPKKVGTKSKGKIVYSVAELLQFQALYEMMPEDFTWADTIGADAVVSDTKGKSKAAKQKDKNRNGNLSMQYDASLVCYFNPTEYSAALNMGLYTGPPAMENADASGTNDGKTKGPVVEPINPVEEAVFAKRRLAPLLDNVGPETVGSILESFMEITISCTHTLQEVIGFLFDHAIAEPSLCESYAQLCTSLSERTPEFKDGAKTINFRRILLTNCYESLIEEPDSHAPHPSKQKNASNGQNGATQHSWRRRCMLRNVGFIGELFRRQLLTENIMHVCVAMMLDDEVKPQPEIIEAACGLLSLVGDLLDGSSPASRRTMDEYFAVLERLRDHSKLPAGVQKLIADLITLRTSGWIKNRQEGNSSAATTPVASPPKITVAVESATAQEAKAPLLQQANASPAASIAPESPPSAIRVGGDADVASVLPSKPRND